MSLLTRTIRTGCGGALRLLKPPVQAAALPCRHAGHSRWQNVRSDKEAGTAHKHSAMELITRLLKKAVVDGGGSSNPQTNVHLKAVFEKARSENIPVKSLERLLAARSQQASEHYVVEVRGRGGICVLIQCSSPTKTKCKQEIASLVKKVGLEVAGIDSQISRVFFSKKGCVEATRDPQKLPSLDRATELALELDCSEVRPSAADGGVAVEEEAAATTFLFECDPGAVAAVSDGLRSAGVEVLDSGVRYEPLDTVSVDPETLALLRGMYDRIREGVDGVVQVFDNVAADRAG